MTLKANQAKNLGLKPGKQGTYVTITEPKSGARFTIAKKLAPQFQGFLDDITQYVKIDKNDVGSYCYRNVRGGNNLSMHAYGCAIDILIATNPLGAKHSKYGKLKDSEVIAIAEKWGLLNGGGYRGRKDWMHSEGSIYIPPEKLPNKIDVSGLPEVEVEELPLIVGNDDIKNSTDDGSEEE
jgi:hypothetical protein